MSTPTPFTALHSFAMRVVIKDDNYAVKGVGVNPRAFHHEVDKSNSASRITIKCVAGKLILCDNVGMIKKKACENLDEQGFVFLSTEEKNKLNIALRVTPSVCIALATIGLYLQSIEIFFVLSIFGILGTLMPKGQPIDVLYNLFARIFGWFKIPASPIQKRFACGVGAFFLIGTTASIYFGNILWMYIFGVSYIFAAGAMALSHFCVASWFYNRVLNR
jgi:hypothetical protein